VRRYFKDPNAGEGWCVPFPGADASVVLRSQTAISQGAVPGQPFYFSAYVNIGSTFNLLLLLFFGLVLQFLAGFSWGRAILLRFPEFFSYGCFSHAGPSASYLKATRFTETFVAKGFKSGVPADPRAKPDLTMVYTLSGPEIGYVTTPIACVQSALCILEERDKLPLAGGVLTTATAFGGERMIQRLCQHGFTFTEGPVKAH